MKKTRVIKMIYAFPTILLLGGMLYVISLASELQEQISQRDKTIQDLAFSDSLVREYFFITRDSIKDKDSTITTTTYRLKEKYQTKETKEITKYVDIHHYHPELIEKHEYILRGKDTLSLNTIIQENNELVKKYNALVKEYNTLGNKYNTLTKNNNKLFESHKICNMALDLIKKHYDIGYTVKKEGNSQIKISLSAEKADSAFLLLPYYRKKLKYDNDKNHWIIK